jgi:hypothetical protein
LGEGADLDGFIQGLLGGIVPAVLMIIVYFIAMSGRLAKIETNICWLKRVMDECLPHLKDRSH